MKTTEEAFKTFLKHRTKTFNVTYAPLQSQVKYLDLTFCEQYCSLQQRV